MKTTKKTVLVLDCGTQSVRASIIDSDGNILKIIKSKYLMDKHLNKCYRMFNY